MQDQWPGRQSSALLKPGMVIQQRYRIEAIAGKGGMGTVYQAADLKLPGKKWALKTVTGEQRRLLRHEAAFMMRLSHPQLPHIVDYVELEQEQFSCIIMEWVEGETLQHRFARAGYKLPIGEIQSYALQLCDCLTYLHSFDERPVIYRDLNPANVMIDRNGMVRLIDFGIAVSANEGPAFKAGTRGFAAPEQLNSKTEEDHRADLYNLGALMFYLLSGGGFADSEKPQQIKRQLSAADVPESMIDIVSKLLRANPGDRYQTAAAVRADLMLNADLPVSVSVEPVRSSEERLIVVGGITRGAGATFTALSLAASFANFNMRNALIEWPHNHPELYHQLFGERHAPPQYRFWTENTDDIKAAEKCADDRWRRGLTSWHPLAPDFHMQSGDEYKWLRLIGRIHSPVKIVDIGADWANETVQSLCRIADSIIMVAEPMPGKFNSQTANEQMKRAAVYKQAGKEVVFAANRWIQSRGQQEWLNSFPWKPKILIPLIRYEEIYARAWKGEIVHENRKLDAQLTNAFAEYVTEQISAMQLDKKQQKTKFLKKWSKKLVKS